jgi:peroxiredoxin
LSKQILPTAAAVLVVLAGVWLMSSNKRPMPDLAFNLVDGRTLHTADLRGRPALINFWSVSCEVCLRDMPVLSRLHETLKDRGLMVIGVAVPHDPPPAVIAAAEKLAPAYPISLDVHGEISKAFGDIKVTPTSFLIDPEGNINYSERGPIDETRIRATLLTFLR